MEDEDLGGDGAAVLQFGAQAAHGGGVVGDLGFTHPGHDVPDRDAAEGLWARRSRAAARE